MSLIKRICIANNYIGNYKYILNSISHIKDEKFHTENDVQNVRNYFIEMNYKNYLAKCGLKEKECKECHNIFIGTKNEKYCKNCLKEAKCCECGKNLRYKIVKSDDSKRYCNICKSRKAKEMNQASGLCTTCGKYNLFRDQNGRGRDIDYGNGKWITKEDIVIRVKDKNNSIGYKLITIKKGTICGCSCSKDFYNKHNSSNKMKEQTRELGLKQGPITITNYNKSEKHKETASKIMTERSGAIDCPKHGRQDKSFNGMCLKCINEAKDYEKQRENAIDNYLNSLNTKNPIPWPQFVSIIYERNGKKYYKEFELTSLCNDILDKTKNIEDFPGLNIRRCKKCGKESVHYLTTCLTCGEINKLSGGKPNFEIRDNVKTYKGIPVDYLAGQILNKEVDINDYPGFEIRCGRVCYRTIDILTDEPIYLDYNFNIVNGVKYYKNTPVKEIVEGFLNNTLNINDYPEFNIRLGKICYSTYDVLTDEIIYLNQNFQIMDGVRFYKNEPVEIVIKKLESGEYNTTEDCPGWNKRFGEWYYGTINVLTGEVTILNNSIFEIHNNVKYIYDSSIGDYVP